MLRAACLLALLVLSGCTRSPGEAPREVSLQQASSKPAAATAPPQTRPADDQAFVDAAAATDMFELRSAELALARSKTPAVRQFAAMMVRDHRQSSAELNQALAEAGQDLVPAAALPGDKQADVLRLTTAELAQFDDAYLRSQVKAHEQALQTLQRYAQAGQVVSLKAYAGKAAGTVRQHHEHARTLLSRVESR
jgi:putative membrane protein